MASINTGVSLASTTKIQYKGTSSLNTGVYLSSRPQMYDSRKTSNTFGVNTNTPTWK